MGEKFLHSKEFYGGIGAKIKESFAVYEMEKDQTSFFVSTTPYNPKEPATPVMPGLPAASGIVLSTGICPVHGSAHAHHNS